MKEPTLKTIKALFARSGNTCAFPRCNSVLVEDSGTVTGKVCHIKAKSKNGPRYDPVQTVKQRHSIGNLILLCGQHHDIIDDKPEIYDVKALHEMKKIHESYMARPERPEDQFFAKIIFNNSFHIEMPSNSRNVVINSLGTVQADNITIKTTKKAIKLEPPKGSIGSSIEHRAYAKHLIDRYNDFASKNYSRAIKFNHGAVYTGITRKLGAKWDMLPISKALKLFSHLQNKIDKTIIGRNNKSNSVKNYSHFEEYCSKHFYENV